jgi:polar amino acid transport system permease protein
VWLGILSLSMTYSAYVAEVYRAGLSSIHPSQSAAARSLGLSYTQTLRRVLVPQAVRRVIPPLLNDFISLQKDTALLSVAAIGEVVLTAGLWQSKLFNLSPVTLAAVFFIVITIPQARFVDVLINRDARRRGQR